MPIPLRPSLATLLVPHAKLRLQLSHYMWAGHSKMSHYTRAASPTCPIKRSMAIHLSPHRRTGGPQTVLLYMGFPAAVAKTCRDMCLSQCNYCALWKWCITYYMGINMRKEKTSIVSVCISSSTIFHRPRHRWCPSGAFSHLTSNISNT